MGFEVIDTQEKLDEIIGSVKRGAKEKAQKELDKEIAEKNELAMKVEELTKELDGKNQALNDAMEKAKGHDEEVEGLQAQIKGYETQNIKTQVAHEMGLSYELVDFLKGDTDEAIRESAETLKKSIGNVQPAPVAQLEPQQETDKTRAGYAQLIRNTVHKED